MKYKLLKDIIFWTIISVLIILITISFMNVYIQMNKTEYCIYSLVEPSNTYFPDYNMTGSMYCKDIYCGFTIKVDECISLNEWFIK